jgi:hypothetical protein
MALRLIKFGYFIYVLYSFIVNYLLWVLVGKLLVKLKAKATISVYYYYYYF